MRMALSFLLLFTGACSLPSGVPEPHRQGSLPAAQAVASVDLCDDGSAIVVTTLAFRQNPNFWVLSASGELRWSRNLAPWAPFEGIALDGGKAFAAGIAYSRVTSPYPTISLFGAATDEEQVLEDSLGEWGCLRYGAGEWRTGWAASLLGDLVVRTGDSIITVRGHDGAFRMLASGERLKYPLPYDRPFRMVAAGGGQALAMGFIRPDVRTVPPEMRGGLRTPPGLLTVTEVTTGKERWSYSPAGDPPEMPPLPEPARDFPALAADFRMTPDAVIPFQVAASAAPSADGSRAAVAVYGGQLWYQRGPAIGAWNPPYHVIPFVPRQRGWMYIAASPGREIVRAAFPKDGLFEVRTDARGERVWAYPMSWFARGSSGAVWLPTDPEGREVFEFDPSRGSWITRWILPDAIADVALRSEGDRALVSCWDGRVYLMGPGARAEASFDVHGAARVRWSHDGANAIVGTDSGEVLCLDAAGKLRWRIHLPSTDAPPVAPPLKPVFEGVPVFSVGRTGKEHAYVGDTWLVKTAKGGFLVDAGGSSSIPFSLARIRAAGIDPKGLDTLLHTHSHGDHAGAAYLWRAMGLRIVAPESASFALSWLMPMLTDYGVWVPRPVDVPLPLRRPGDEYEFSVAGIRVRAVFVPGHSMDSVIYLMELEGRRVAFTGDIGFQAPSDILHRCWNDVNHARRVSEVVAAKVIPFRPDVVFTGHGGRPEGTAFLEDLVRRTQESIQRAGPK